jgi:hypothetical protein
VRIHSYVVARDYAFAPNPFHGACTLATCKPLIRGQASVGDWVIGTGSAVYGLTGHLVFAMRVDEALTYDEYWYDPRFRAKRPDLTGSLKQAFGDNIYWHDDVEGWHQLDSHHSLADGSPNTANVIHDTKTNRVLVSQYYAYFGSAAPLIPRSLRIPEDICGVRGHRSNFSDDLVHRFITWFESLSAQRMNGRPSEWLLNGALR